MVNKGKSRVMATQGQGGVKGKVTGYTGHDGRSRVIRRLLRDPSPIVVEACLTDDWNFVSERWEIIEKTFLRHVD